MMARLLKRPAGFLPPAISVLLLALIAAQILNGSPPPKDEGTTAHLFQILMPVQALIIGYFALTWLPKEPKAAAQVLTVQCGAALAVLASVYFLRL